MADQPSVTKIVGCGFRPTRKCRCDGLGRARFCYEYSNDHPAHSSLQVRGHVVGFRRRKLRPHFERDECPARHRYWHVAGQAHIGSHQLAQCPIVLPIVPLPRSGSKKNLCFSGHCINRLFQPHSEKICFPVQKRTGHQARCHQDNLAL